MDPGDDADLCICEPAVDQIDRNKAADHAECAEVKEKSRRIMHGDPFCCLTVIFHLLIAPYRIRRRPAPSVLISIFILDVFQGSYPLHFTSYFVHVMIPERLSR